MAEPEADTPPGVADSFTGIVASCRDLAPGRLSASQVRQINRRLGRADLTVGVRVAFLGDITFEPLPDYTAAAGACCGLPIRTYVGPYKQHVQELMIPGSGLASFNPDVVLIVLTIREQCPEIALRFAALGETEVRAAAETLLGRIEETARLALERTTAAIVIGNFPTPDQHQLGIADQKQAYGEAEFHAGLNLELARRFKHDPRVQVLDLDRLAGRFGKARVRDQKLYYLAKMPWRESFLPLLADEIVRHVEAARGLAKKCLVLDLDNTLWGGILGEAGVHGVKVGHGDPESEAFHDFQLKLRSLRDRGILLALCSKNNYDDVKELFDQRPELPLALADFAAVEINWEMKHRNIQAIARKLNLGTDSLVFLDDSPAECELVRQMLPEVHTVLLPRDPADYGSVLDEIHGFDRARLVSEDLQKARQYQETALRVEFRTHFDGVEDYLASLGTTITIGRAEPPDVSRVHQLFSKTNQFNLTTRRYSLADVEAFIRSLRHELHVVQATDRFGDMGTIGLCLVEVGAEGGAHIDSFILSCRAMGRGIETAVLNCLLGEYFENRGILRVSAEYLPTAKNKPVEMLYEEYGFTGVDGNGTAGKRYALTRAGWTLQGCGWIRVVQRLTRPDQPGPSDASPIRAHEVGGTP